MYLLDTGGKHRKPKFKTLEEANRVANRIQQATGVVLGVYDVKQYKQMLKEERRNA